MSSGGDWSVTDICGPFAGNAGRQPGPDDCGRRGAGIVERFEMFRTRGDCYDEIACMRNLLQTPFLTRQRIWLAFVVAVVCDGLQLFCGPAGWLGVDQVIDVVAMALVTLILG